MDERTRDVLPLIAWLGSLVIAIVAFTAMGGGLLAAPPLTAPSRWADWAADRDGIVATVAVMRLVVLAMAWYLVGTTTIGAVARVARWARLVRFADALSVPMVRRLLQASLGVGLATTVVVSSTGAVLPAGPTTARVAAQTAQPPPPTMRPVHADTPVMQPVDADPAPTAADPADEVAPPGMRPLPADPPSATEAPTPDPAVADVAAAGVAPTPQAATVTVQVGDHLWSIAERHLTATRGADLSDVDVAPYWRQLIEANRDRLVDPANPDLIVPGQEFVLPAPAPGGEAP